MGLRAHSCSAQVCDECTSIFTQCQRMQPRKAEHSFSISGKGLRVVTGTPLVRRGEGTQTLYWPFNTSPFYNDSEMGPATSQMGPINCQLDPNFQKGTLVCQKGRVSQMGPYSPARDPIFTRGGVRHRSGAILVDRVALRECDGDKRLPYWWNSVCRCPVSRMVSLNRSGAMG
jgi:hypothetical protein